MERKTAEMIDEKRCFIKAIETMLAADRKNNQVYCLEYKVRFQDLEMYDEFIDVIYENGHTMKILATGNSNSANLREIIKEVY